MQWRDGLLVVVSLLAGPPIAALVALLGIGVARTGPGAVATFDVQFYTATILFAYILTWLPMLVAAVANAVLSRFVSETWRLLLALPVGAVPFVVQLGWLADNEAGGSDVADLLSVGLGGALASLVCVAAIEVFGPKLRRHS